MNDYTKQYFEQLQNYDKVQYNFAEADNKKIFDSFKQAMKGWLIKVFPKNSGSFVDDVVDELTKTLFDNNGDMLRDVIVSAAQRVKENLEKKPKDDLTPEEVEKLKGVTIIINDKGQGFFKSVFGALGKLVSGIVNIFKK